MTYQPQTWVDYPDTSSPITAARLNHIEDGVYRASDAGNSAKPDVSSVGSRIGVVPRVVSGGYLFDVTLNGKRSGSKVGVAGTSAVETDFGLRVANVGTSGNTDFEAIRYGSVSETGDSCYATSPVDLEATGVTVTVRATYQRMSPRVIRKRVYLVADTTTTVRLTDGLYYATTRMSAVSLGAAQNGSIVGMVFCGQSSTETPGVGVGIGVVDSFRCRRAAGDSSTSATACLGAPPNVASGFRAVIGSDASDNPVFQVGTTEVYVDVFFWAASWRDAYTKQQQLLSVIADACGVPAGADDIVRACAASAMMNKWSSARAGTTPSVSYTPGSGRTFVRDSFWAQMSMEDHAFSAAMLNRFATSLGTGTGAPLNCAPDFIDNPSSPNQRTVNDNNALLLLWAYWLRCRSVADGNSATVNGVTDTIRNNLIGYLEAYDDGTGRLVFPRGGSTGGTTPGHYDWYTVPSSISNYRMPHLDGYYACALTAAYRLGYAPTGITTKIANATSAYQAAYDSSLGHLRFLQNTTTGSWLTYGSLLDLLPEWHAVFVLGLEQGLLGQEITAACVDYFMDAHLVQLASGGRALRTMMQHGGTDYVSSTEMASIPNGVYVNGGSQLPFDFMIASLGHHYGVAGMRSFWADRKRAEVNVDAVPHEAITLANPSPDPTSNPYNGRTTNWYMAWHGVVAAFEPVSGLVA